jgi:hypothetical protein
MFDETGPLGIIIYTRSVGPLLSSELCCPDAVRREHYNDLRYSESIVSDNFFMRTICFCEKFKPNKSTLELGKTGSYSSLNHDSIHFLSILAPGLILHPTMLATNSDNAIAIHIMPTRKPVLLNPL